MEMNRRNFIGTMLATLAAPAIVKAEILMPIKPVVWLPKWTLPLDTSVNEVGNGWLRVISHHGKDMASAYIKPSDVNMDCIPRLSLDGKFDFSHLNGGKGLCIQDPQTYSVQHHQIEIEKPTRYIATSYPFKLGK
jgi:hypothetical protein